MWMKMSKSIILKLWRKAIEYPKELILSGKDESIFLFIKLNPFN